MADGKLGRSPTFLVGAEKQRHLLDEFQKRDQHLSEAYQKNKPLSYNSSAYQKTHPTKAAGKGHRDADATLVSPMLLGVADGVSQIEDFGMDASELPHELLETCEELARLQLFPGQKAKGGDSYMGPVQLMKEAYEATESMGSTTILLAIMDNSTQIHSRLHPMIAVLSIGDCELLILRRSYSREPTPLQAVFHTEMQRIDGHAQSPLQVARVDDRVDPDFDERSALEVIERGSAVHCLSAYEGDILVMGSDGVFDNLFEDEIVAVCNEILPPPEPNAPFEPLPRELLYEVARRVVADSHAKTRMVGGWWPDTPIGRGGKMDDTCCVVGEVVEWTEEHGAKWQRAERRRKWGMFGCGCSAEDSQDSAEEEGMMHPSGAKTRSVKAQQYEESAESTGSEEEQDRCCLL